MTVSTSTNSVTYVATGATNTFDYDFVVYDESHFVITLDGVEVTSGFTVTGLGDGAGGTVVFDTNPTGTLVILRRVPFTQDIDYSPYDPFPAETHERGLDLGVMRDQQLKTEVDQAQAGADALKIQIDGLVDEVTEQADRAEAAADAAETALENLGPARVNWTFTTGGAFQYPNEAAFNSADGNYYSYIGPDSFPFTVAPGTNPVSNVLYQPRTDVLLRAELSDVDGAGLIGGATYAQIRAYNGNATKIKCLGRSTVFDGADGVFVVDLTDTTSIDDGGYCLIDTLGRRWKRQYSGPVKMAWYVDQFSNAIQTSGVQAAIDFTALLSGDTHDTNYTGSSPTPPAFYQQYGAVRVLEWVPCKVRVASTITLKNAISVLGCNGGLLADESWSGSGYILDQDWNPYSGLITDLTVDGNETTAKGIRCRSASYCYWQNIKVVSVRDDGFTHLDGPECIIDGLEVVTSLNPVSRQVAGFKSNGGDSHYNNIVTRFSPVGFWQEGNGNNNYHNCHPWGLYTKQKMYVGFYVKNSSGNQMSMCYSDSPTKSDYAQANNVTLADGFINGGYGWLFTGSSRDNVIGSDCRCFINETDYLANGNPNSPTLWMVGFHSGLPNTVEGLTERPGSYFWNTTFEYLATADRQNARVMRAVRSERRRVGGNTQSTGWYHAVGFGQKIQDLGNVSGNWGVNFASGCYVRLNTTAATTLQVSSWPASDVDNTAAEVTFFVTGTNAPTFNVNIRTPSNAVLPTPSVRGLILKGAWDPVASLLIFHTVTNL